MTRDPNDLRLAVVIDPTLPLGNLANTVAALSIGLGAGEPGLGGVRLTDAEGRQVTASSNRPVPILQADPTALRALLLKTLPPPDGGLVVAFPQFARALHSFADYAAAFPRHDLGCEAIDGIGLAGPSRWVRSLTGCLRLLR